MAVLSGGGLVGGWESIHANLARKLLRVLLTLTYSYLLLLTQQTWQENYSGSCSCLAHKGGGDVR